MQYRWHIQYAKYYVNTVHKMLCKYSTKVLCKYNTHRLYSLNNYCVCRTTSVALPVKAARFLTRNTLEELDVSSILAAPVGIEADVCLAVVTLSTLYVCVCVCVRACVRTCLCVGVSRCVCMYTSLLILFTFSSSSP